MLEWYTVQSQKLVGFTPMRVRLPLSAPKFFWRRIRKHEHHRSVEDTFLPIAQSGDVFILHGPNAYFKQLGLAEHDLMLTYNFRSKHGKFLFLEQIGPDMYRYKKMDAAAYAHFLAEIRFTLFRKLATLVPHAILDRLTFLGQ